MVDNECIDYGDRVECMLKGDFFEIVFLILLVEGMWLCNCDKTKALIRNTGEREGVSDSGSGRLIFTMHGWYVGNFFLQSSS